MDSKQSEPNCPTDKPSNFWEGKKSIHGLERVWSWQGRLLPEETALNLSRPSATQTEAPKGTVGVFVPTTLAPM